MKKLITYCIVLVLALNLIPAGVNAADGAEYDKSVSALIAFGIMSGEASEINQEDILTREQAALWISRAMAMKAEYKTSIFSDVAPGGQYSNAILALNEWRIINGSSDGCFHPGDPISYADFVTLLVQMLEFDRAAEIYGGYPNGYIKEAGNLKLNKNTNAVSAKELSIGAGAQILYNALQTVMRDTEKTPLEAFSEIYMAEGRVEKDHKTGLTSPEGVTEGRLMIGGTVYHADAIDAEYYLGKNVTVFYTLEDGVEWVKHIELDKRFKEITVRAEDIVDEKSDRRELVYEQNNKETKLKISPVADVIYNGKAYPDITAEEFYPECGEIRLLDSDNDSVYDVLFITKYDVFYVSNAIAHTRTIYNKFSGEGFVSSISFNDDATVDYYDAYGESMDFSDIEINGIVLVASSATGKEGYYRVVISDRMKKGVFNGLDDDYIIIDGEEYSKSAAFDRAVQTNLLPAQELNLEYYFYFDIYGAVVAYDKIYEGNRYGYLKRAYTDIDTEKSYVKIFTEDAVWEKYEIKDKVTLNNVEYSDSGAVRVIDVNVMVRYKTDSKGRIKLIDTPQRTNIGDENMPEYIKSDKFRKAQVNNLKYYTMNKSFDNTFFAEPDVKVFLIPTAAGASDDDFMCTDMSYFVSETRYTADVYDMDEFMFSSIIAIEYDSSSSDTLAASLGDNDYCMMVDKVKEIYVDDEVVSYVSGIIKGQEWSYTAASANVFAGLKRGDIIRTKYDDSGKINHYISVHKAGTEDRKSNVSEVNNSKYIYGTLLSIDYEKNRLRIDQGSELTITTANSPYITVYESGDNEIRNGNLQDLRPGDYVVFRMRTSVPYEIFVIKQ